MMAVKSKAWRTLAAATGGAEASFGKADLSLNRHGFSMPGKPGGGKNAPQVDERYLSHLIVVPAVPLPSEAGEWVGRFYKCGYIGSSLQAAPINALAALSRGESSEPVRWFAEEANLHGKNAIGFVAQLIRQLAVLPEHDRKDMASRIDVGKSNIRFELEPQTGVVFEVFVWDDGQENMVAHSFYPDDDAEQAQLPLERQAPQPFAPIQRSATVPMRLLFVAADLLADSWAAAGGDLPFPSSGNEPGPASSDHSAPETENAADPAKSAALRGDQPRSLATEPSSDSGKVCERETPFKGFSSAGGHLPATSSKEAPSYGQPRPHTSVPVAA